MVIGTLAHVDAGKTTFTERVLYETGALRTPGSVDRGTALLDDHPLEKRRGITIFSGQACLNVDGREVFWLDTPGHVDFSPEAERALSVLDAAILLVSAVDGVQSYTETLLRRLRERKLPTIIFLNKCDRETADPDRAAAQLRRLCDTIDLRGWQRTGILSEETCEEIAALDEELMERYLAGEASAADCLPMLWRLTREQAAFPVLCGSALTGEGVRQTLRAVLSVLPAEHAPDAPFAAQCFRIRREEHGARLCFLKVLSGSVTVKDRIQTCAGEISVNELLRYHADRCQSVRSARAGELIAIPLPEGVAIGERIGSMPAAAAPCALPVAMAEVLWDETVLSRFDLLRCLRILEEEEPTLAVEETPRAVQVHVTGRVQLEVLAEVLRDRFGAVVSFGPFRVSYRETIAAPVLGIGHYEPLKHYAEVHLRLLPAPSGSGIRFVSSCHVDVLSLNWQRLIETHVFEKTHRGVLTGAPLTDVTIELLSGRDHLKHTEGGDFRQATYRAIRNALMYAESVLLAPVCRFVLRAPTECFGCLSTELNKMGAESAAPDYVGETIIQQGTAFYAPMLDFIDELPLLTHGRGSIEVEPAGFAPDPAQEAAVTALRAETGYNPLAEDSPDSVFCKKGAGFLVPWDEVRAWAHIEPEL